LQKCRKYAISKLIFENFSAPDPLMGEATTPKPHSIGVSVLRTSRALGSRSFHLPYLEIKLTFECTALFYGLTPPLTILSTVV